VVVRRQRETAEARRLLQLKHPNAVTDYYGIVYHGYVTTQAQTNAVVVLPYHA
jgi:hypothetical protein